MNRIEDLNDRYASCAELLRNGVEIVRVADSEGARFNSAALRLLSLMRDTDPGPWVDLAGAVRAMRWRMVTQPQPILFNAGLRDIAEQVVVETIRLRGAVLDDALLDEIADVAQAASASVPLLASVLWSSIEELGPIDCVVVPASRAAKEGLQAWLGELGVRVMSIADLHRERLQVEQIFAVGPPRFFDSSLVTAPPSNGVSFLMPTWFGDRSIPQSAIAQYADNAIRVKTRTFTVGDLNDALMDALAPADEEAILPMPIWGNLQPPVREPNRDEVVAWKVLLSDNLAIWLDDGDRIRALDPNQPSGERVTYCDIPTVRPGTYLLLRQGETEQGALYAAALQLLGTKGVPVTASQHAWKDELSRRLKTRGKKTVVTELAQLGITRADRAPTWTAPYLVRPQSDHDFETLLKWLQIPIQPTFGFATTLRRMIHQASADVREKLEDAVSAADLSELECEGKLSLDAQKDGFRSIIATRVLAISPHQVIVPRQQVRVLFEDGGAKWLE